MLGRQSVQCLSHLALKAPTRKRFIWNPRSRSYRTPAGRTIPQVAIRAQLDKAVDKTQIQLERIAQAYVQGRINQAEWFIRTDDLLTRMHSGAGQIAVGGKEQMTPRLLGRLGAAIREQKAYLRGLEQEVGIGRQLLNKMFIARIGMFADAVIGTYENMRRGLMIGSEIREEKRVLATAAPHCVDCPPLAGDWQPYGTLPPIGASQCRARCRCRFIYR